MERIQAYFWRVDQERQYLAHLTASVIQPHTKKKVKGTDIYRSTEKKKKPGALSVEERKKRFDELVERMGPDVIPVRIQQ